MRWCDSRPSIGDASSAVAIRRPVEVQQTDIGDAVALCALCPFASRTDIPSVRSLSLTKGVTMDERTARSFPRLAALRVETRNPVSLRWFDAAPLEVLAFRDKSFADHSVLRTTRIRELRLEWMGMPLHEIPSTIRRLAINAWRPVAPSDLSVLSDLQGLEELALSGRADLKDLRVLAKAPSLTTVMVAARSLTGVERLERLRSLRLIVHAPAVAPLASARALESVEIRARHAPADLDLLSKVSGLKRLLLDLGDIGGLADVKSISFLSELPALEELIIRGARLLDGDLKVLRTLKLRKLELAGDFGPQASSLASALPTATVRVVGNTDGAGFYDVVQVAGLWVLFSDLARELGYENNYEVERAVKEDLSRTAPDVISRVQFDSEAGAFCVRAKTRKDVDEVATKLRTMKRSVG